jgi:hypothetical protein
MPLLTSAATFGSNKIALAVSENEFLHAFRESFVVQAGDDTGGCFFTRSFACPTAMEKTLFANTKISLG